MILISHRGNIDGKQPNLENAPYYINNTLKMGYNVEIDVWWYKDNFYLGHDEPMYKVEIKYLQDYRLWCHAKNIEAIIEFQKYPHIHYFWHQEDDICLTSKNYIYAYPGKQPIKNSIAVLPELYNDDLSICKGICSDYIKLYK
tara:strand:+ start:103 stop:531 length:429 start_codon:yes stop_codon:yes gene_type:complete